MRKHLSKIVTACLIPSVSLAAVLCCSFSGMPGMGSGRSSIALAETEKLPPCHAPKHKTQVPQKKNCNCCIEKKLQADLLAKVSFQNIQEIIAYVSAIVLPQQVVILKDKSLSAYLNGPPGPAFEIPLYIDFRNFRI